MSDVNSILRDFVSAIQADVAGSLQEKGRFASGQTIQSLEVVDIADEKVELQGPPWIICLEKGRPPTSQDAAKGDPTIFQRIQEWVQFKGIPTAAVYAITQKIHKQGYKGTPGVLSEPLREDNINKRAEEAAGKLSDLFIKQILEA